MKPTFEGYLWELYKNMNQDNIYEIKDIVLFKSDSNNNLFIESHTFYISEPVTISSQRDRQKILDNRKYLKVKLDIFNWKWQLIHVKN